MLLSALFATPMPGLCLLGSNSLLPRIPRTQRGPKEEAKRTQRGGIRFFRGEYIVRHRFSGSPSQVSENSVTFLNRTDGGRYTFAVSVTEVAHVNNHSIEVPEDVACYGKRPIEFF